MKTWPPSIRGRLTLWYAGALALILLLVSAVLYGLLRQKIVQQLQARLEVDGGVVAEVIAELREGELEEGEPAPAWLLDELEEYTDLGVLTLIRIRRGDSLFFVTEEWREDGLDAVPADLLPGSHRLWKGVDNTLYLLQASEFREEAGFFRVTLAVEAEALMVLRSFVRLFLLLFPLSLGLAALGGWLISRRALAPVAIMASAAERIGSRNLSERLPVGNPDDELGRLAAVFNATLARLERSFEQLRRFTAEASHALRTPLTALRSVGEVGLQEGDGPDDYRDLIGSMLEETDRLRALVENLLTLTRAEGGQLRTVPEPFGLGEMAGETVERLRVLADEKAQDLKLEIVTDIAVTADREMIRQALLNLLDNAIRNTPPGGSIRVVVDRSPQGGGAVEVRDNGRGIASEHLDHIFDRFFSVTGRPDDGPQGAGLGLAIAQQAIVLNGGRIEVESDVGSGSCFRIVLPPASPG